MTPVDAVSSSSWRLVAGSIHVRQQTWHVGHVRRGPDALAVRAHLAAPPVAD
ncbi:MAG: hypothetical protein ACRDHM_01450 [Actinomycetota bacterium]